MFGARAKRGRHTPNTGEAGAGRGLTGVRRAPSCAACPVGDAAHALQKWRRHGALERSGEQRSASDQVRWRMRSCMPIRRSLFGELRGVPSTAQRGWASSRSLEGKRSAQASAMEAEGERRHRWLDAQHDSATRHRRGRTNAFNADAQRFVEPGMCRCPSPRTRRTVFTHLLETTKPTIRRNGFVPKHVYGCTVPRDSVLRQSAIQCMK